MPTELMTPAYLATLAGSTVVVYLLGTVLRAVWSTAPIKPITLFVAIALSLVFWWFGEAPREVLFGITAFFNGCLVWTLAFNASVATETMFAPKAAEGVAGAETFAEKSARWYNKW